ncbi:MAG: hypothetical protein WBC80_00835, partial [Isosphaeraceae bacterium]
VQQALGGPIGEILIQEDFDPERNAVPPLGNELGSRSGLTHHFSLGFLGFSWKIQDIHMMLRK